MARKENPFRGVHLKCVPKGVQRILFEGTEGGTAPPSPQPQSVGPQPHTQGMGCRGRDLPSPWAKNVLIFMMRFQTTFDAFVVFQTI